MSDIAFIMKAVLTRTVFTMGVLTMAFNSGASALLLKAYDSKIFGGTEMSSGTITITRRMENAFREFDNNFPPLYEKEDFERKLNEVSKARKSERPTRMMELYEMFLSCGIEFDKDKEEKYYADLIKSIEFPSFSDIEDKLLHTLFVKYSDYPSPEEYMKRIVDRLSSDDDHWENDTLRLRILKQFIKNGNCLTYQREMTDDNGNTKKKKVTLYGGEMYIKQYLREKTGKPVKIVLDNIENIGEDVFDVLPEATKEQKKPSGKYGLLKIVDDLAQGRFRTGGSTKKSLYLFAMVFGMTYNLYRLDSSDGFGSNVSALDYDTDIEKNLFQDYYANNLMRFLSSSYQNQSYEFELDPSGQGINYKNYAEVVYLYYISKDICPQDKIRLSSEMIQKIPEIRKQHLKAEKSAADHQVTGNESPKTEFYRDFFKKDANTLFMDDVLDLPEEQFIEFICDNYNCETDTGKTIIGEMQLETEQRSAFKQYQIIIDKLIGQLREEDDGLDSQEATVSAEQEEGEKEREKLLRQCNYGLWFTDVAAFNKGNAIAKREALYERILSMISDTEKKDIIKKRGDIPKAIDDFVALLFAINSFMGATVSEGEGQKNTDKEWTETSVAKTKALFVSSAAEITRTSMIVAYYYYYNAVHAFDGSDAKKSFKEVFDAFSEGLDRHLQAAYYQPLSGRNLLDILVVFSSYAYIHDWMF